MTQEESECHVVLQWGVCVCVDVPRLDMFEQMVYGHVSVQERR